MKKKDFLLILFVCAAAAAVFAAFRLILPEKNTKLIITVDGEVYGTYSLEEDQTIEINGTNVCKINSGVAVMTEADCPDQLCVHQKEIAEAGETIVCLPNRVVLEISGNSHSQTDATAG